MNTTIYSDGTVSINRQFVAKINLDTKTGVRTLRKIISHSPVRLSDKSLNVTSAFHTDKIGGIVE